MDLTEKMLKEELDKASALMREKIGDEEFEKIEKEAREKAEIGLAVVDEVVSQINETCENLKKIFEQYKLELHMCGVSFVTHLTFMEKPAFSCVLGSSRIVDKNVEQINDLLKSGKLEATCEMAEF